MTPEDLNYLNDMAQPLCKIRDADTAGALHLQTELEPHEVRLIVLKKRDG
jgi:xylan 1,4-beta-xylosidase